MSREQQARLTEQFLRASTSGDMQELLNLLADDIVFIGDGGGKVPVALKPVHGADKVARGTTGGLRFFSPEMQTCMEEVNGKPAIFGYLYRHPCGVLMCEIEGERIRVLALSLVALCDHEHLSREGEKRIESRREPFVLMPDHVRDDGEIGTSPGQLEKSALGEFCRDSNSRQARQSQARHHTLLDRLNTAKLKGRCWIGAACRFR